MKPIVFQCSELLERAPAEIAAVILDLSQWTRFQGYGILPGIQSAEFETRTPEVVGTRIRVRNTDGSSHVEEIIEWRPDQRVALLMHEFSKPLSRLATKFRECWDFEPHETSTRVTRSFELFPRNLFARLPLWLISRLLKKAIARNLREMKEPHLEQA